MEYPDIDALINSSLSNWNPFWWNATSSKSDNGIRRNPHCESRRNLFVLIDNRSDVNRLEKTLESGMDFRSVRWPVRITPSFILSINTGIEDAGCCWSASSVRIQWKLFSIAHLAPDLIAAPFPRLVSWLRWGIPLSFKIWAVASKLPSSIKRNCRISVSIKAACNLRMNCSPLNTGTTTRVDESDNETARRDPYWA